MQALREITAVKNHKLELVLPNEYEGEQVEVIVLRLGKSPKKSSNNIVDILNKLAAENTNLYDLDPVQWQKEVREDKPLPGRE